MVGWNMIMRIGSRTELRLWCLIACGIEDGQICKVKRLLEDVDLGCDRIAVYRNLKKLEDHGLVLRDDPPSWKRILINPDALRPGYLKGRDLKEVTQLWDRLRQTQLKSQPE